MKFQPKPPVSKVKKASGRRSIQKVSDEDKPIIDQEVMRRLRPRRAVRKIAVGGDADSADRKLQVSSQAHSQSEQEEKEKKTEPYIVLPLRPDNTNLEELNKMEFGQNSLTSAEMEASINPARDLCLEQESEKERMLFFQFPKCLSLEIPAAIAEETENKGKKKAKKMGCNLQQLPAGCVGKMLVYKSGKVKMKLGDVIFNVNPGSQSICHQQAVAINPKKGHFCVIGNIDEQHVVVTPDVNTLLQGLKK